MFGWKPAQTLTQRSAGFAANRIADNKNADTADASFARRFAPNLTGNLIDEEISPFSARPQGGVSVAPNTALRAAAKHFEMLSAATRLFTT
jgi:hypothetical protein